MPVYMNSGKIVADGRDGTGRVGKSKVLQEVLADLKKDSHVYFHIYSNSSIRANRKNTKDGNTLPNNF